MVDTSKINEKELEKLHHTQETGNQELSEKLVEHLPVSRLALPFTIHHSALAQEAQVPTNDA